MTSVWALRPTATCVADAGAAAGIEARSSSATRRFIVPRPAVEFLRLPVGPGRRRKVPAGGTSLVGEANRDADRLGQRRGLGLRAVVSEARGLAGELRVPRLRDGE